MLIRESQAGDRPGIEALYRDAFPDEDLLPLVAELLQDEIPVLSLVAAEDQAVLGHMILTLCDLGETQSQVWILGPLGVVTSHQGQGVGSALVRDGLARLKGQGAWQVHVLGDPAYYGRFGFVGDNRVTPPYPLPVEWDGAWQALSLREDGGMLTGRLQPPAPWLHRSLWSPP